MEKENENFLKFVVIGGQRVKVRPFWGIIGGLALLSIKYFEETLSVAWIVVIILWSTSPYFAETLRKASTPLWNLDPTGIRKIFVYPLWLILFFILGAIASMAVTSFFILPLAAIFSLFTT